MRYCTRALLTFLFLSTNAYALQPKIEIFEQFDNLKMVAFISTAEIENSPEWNPNLAPPPLTVGEAIQAVKDYVKTSETLGPVNEIEIRQVPKYEKNWHYLIKVANESMKSKYDVYVVLMNGMVIPAIIEPQGYK
jgi:hypothetical protein